MKHADPMPKGASTSSIIWATTPESQSLPVEVETPMNSGKASRNGAKCMASHRT
jgi:hypothetical protein